LKYTSFRKIDFGQETQKHTSKGKNHKQCDFVTTKVNSTALTLPTTICIDLEDPNIAIKK